VFVCIVLLQVAELGSVASPDQNSEYLIWVCCIEVDEGGLTPAAHRLVNTSYFATHGSDMSYVVLSLHRSNVLFGLSIDIEE
jgi:hypothetical protein